MPEGLDDTQQLKEAIRLIRASDGKDKALFLASYLPLYSNDLKELVKQYEDATIYDNMTTADEIVQRRVVAQKLALWRAELWSLGFNLRHPHPVIKNAFQRFSEKAELPLLVQNCMNTLSSMNNSTLIWRKGENGELEYVRFYNPAMTRIDRIHSTLWIKPTDELSNDIKGANEKDIQEYLARNNGSSLKKWVEYIRDPGKATSISYKYHGYIPLKNDDGEYWLLFHGDGDKDQWAYSPVTMLSIFGDIDLLQLLIDGDWSTAFLMKNVITKVTVGESVTSGPMAGSKKNWATKKDLENIQAHMEKPGKVQIVYGNHTLNIEYVIPDPAVYAPEKYEAVIDRICWYFGIGPYAMLGANRRGGSYSMAVWNVQGIRTDAESKRSVVASTLTKFLMHETILPVVFRGIGDIYVHEFVGEIEKRRILKASVEFKDLDALNGGFVEYSKDGFVTSKKYPIAHVMADVNKIVLQKLLPEGVEEGELRLRLKPKVALQLYGPPEVGFKTRTLKEDRQALAELQAAIQQGPLSNITFLNELGWDFEEQMANKQREWQHRPNLIPIFEKNQGLLENILYGLDDLVSLDSDEDVSEDGNGNPPKTRQDQGRPESREETQEDTSEQPRPSQA